MGKQRATTILLSVLAFLSLAGCPEGGLESDPLVGEWLLTGGSGGQVMITFKSNGTFKTPNVEGDLLTGTWRSIGEGQYYGEYSDSNWASSIVFTMTVVLNGDTISIHMMQILCQLGDCDTTTNDVTGTRVSSKADIIIEIPALADM